MIPTGLQGIRGRIDGVYIPGNGVLGGVAREREESNAEVTDEWRD
jgi:hypothetical protein